MIQGNLRKLKNSLVNGSAVYSIVLFKDDLQVEELSLNTLVGKKINLKFLGEIKCVSCGRITSKSFSQGYCFPCMRSLAECDMCILKPHECHFYDGTCRDESWAKKHCFSPHIVYLANSSGLKVGITREENIPTRWIDQGAISALPIVKVQMRLDSGKFEKFLSEHLNDKTNWRKMLKNEVDDIDLAQERERIFNDFGDVLEELEDECLGSELLEGEDVVDIDYPVIESPEKVKSMSFDKIDSISGKLMGIKGQYLILDNGVINIRKHTGYKIEVSYE